jgi:hemoglobin
MTMRLLSAVLLLLLALPFAPVVAEAAAGIPDPAPAHPELRERPSTSSVARPGLTALMDDFMLILLDDPRMAVFFEQVDQQRVKDKLVEQFCVILGGDCEYTGMDMVEAHAGIEVTHADFNILVEDLQIAMARRGISDPRAEQAAGQAGADAPRGDQPLSLARPCSQAGAGGSALRRALPREPLREETGLYRAPCAELVP